MEMLRTLTGHTEAFVTMLQMAGISSLSKRTLEKWLKRKSDPLPPPEIKGEWGKPHRWRWSTIRPWLQLRTRILLPEQFPGHLFQDGRAARG